MPKSFGREVLILFGKGAGEPGPRPGAVVDEAGNGAAAVVGEGEDEQPVRVPGRVIIWLMVRQASSMLREASAAGLGAFRSSGRAGAWVGVKPVAPACAGLTSDCGAGRGDGGRPWRGLCWWGRG
jgi:hypothetical protein